MKVNKEEQVKKEYVKIACQDQDTFEAVIYGLNVLSSEISRQVDRFIMGTGKGKSDTVIKYDAEKAKFTVESKPTNKGKVFYYSDADGLWQNDYSALVQDDFYATIKDGNVVIFRYNENELDESIGTIKDIEHLEKELKNLPLAFQAEKQMQEAKKLLSAKNAVEVTEEEKRVGYIAYEELNESNEENV
jgi:hypothetical protein